MSDTKIWIQINPVLGGVSGHITIFIYQDGVTTQIDGNQSQGQGPIPYSTQGTVPVDNQKDPTFGNVIIDIRQQNGEANLPDATQLNLTSAEADAAANAIFDSILSRGDVQTAVDSDGVPRTYVDLEVGYKPVGPNSTSVARTLLEEGGIDFEDAVGAEGWDADDLHGSQAIIDSPEDGENYTIEADENIIFIDKGGNDTISVEKGGGVDIRLDEAASGTKTIDLEGYDKEDVELVRWGDDLIIISKEDGIIRVIVRKHFSDGNGARVEIEFSPDANGNGGNGEPITFDPQTGMPVDDPNDLGANDLDMEVPPEQHWFVAFWEATGDAQWMGSPLVLDLDGDGVELVSLENSQIFWDIDEDGFAEHSGWVAPDDGMLAIDLNGDGLITEHAELFGSITQDGFSALSVYDTNTDNVIDANDTQFSDLLIWQDEDQDGVSDTGELYTLADLDIVSIDLNAATPYEMYIEGHHISHTSSYTVDDGVNAPQTLEIVDAWYEYNNQNSEFIGDYTLDSGALFMPSIRGYGDLPSLHIAASMDNDYSDADSLISQLMDFTFTNFSDLFAGDKSIMDQTRDIMLRWAGADTVDPTSMGQWADAQELTFINALRGEQWLLFGNSPNPWAASSEGLQKAFDIAHYAITARLIAQASGAELFNDGTYYNPVTDAFGGFKAFNQDALDELVEKSLDGTQVENKTEYWVQVVNLVDNSIGISNLDTTQYNVLEASIQASDSTLTIVDLQDKIAKNIEDNLSWTPDGDYILGTSAIDTYDGTVGDDFYSGAAGDDILNGGLGNDQLRGDANNDTLDGQLGNDILWGGHGDDTYKFFLGHGDDTILDTSGNDKILFGAGITATDLSFIRVGYYDLVIQIDPNVGYGSIHIQNQMSAALIETLEFDDGSTFDMTILDHTYIGTEGNDTIYGVRTGFGGTGVDTIYGNGGDDVIYGYGPTGGASATVQNTIYGGDGNDTLFAENGGDYLNGEAGDDDIRGHVGNDTIIGGLGNDVLDGSRGDDVYHFNYGDGNDVIEEDRGADKIVFGSGITAAMLDITRLNNNDVLIDIDGGLGGSIEIDWQTYGTYTILETLEFSDGSTLDLTALDLTLNGTTAGETLYGVRFGGSGIDTIYGHEGNDVIYGYRQVADYDNNFLYAGDGDDTVYAAHGDDYVEGNDGNDNIYGYSGVDTIYGGSGDDTLRGGNQDDLLYGEDGDDILLGENNDDTLIGGLGVDTLTGGGGSDTFTFLAASSFDAVDTITDFNTTYDAIDISDVLSGYDPLTDAITDFVQITDDGTDSTLFIDADGGADNFVAIALIDNKVGLTDEAALETSGNLITI